tara:strand:+ start:3312 stop:4025 length:714 start_codon:yes stop_codon:yes gene_type:complete
MDRDSRRIQNSKEGGIRTLNRGVSSKTVLEGDHVFSKPKGKTLALYKKHQGVLYKNNFSKDGNQIVDRDINVGRAVNPHLYKVQGHNWPAFRATITNGQTIASHSSNFTDLTFSGELYDNDNNFASNVFVTPIKGIYHFELKVLYDDDDSDEIDAGERMDLRISNSTDGSVFEQAVNHTNVDYASNKFILFTCSTDYLIESGKTIKAQVLNASGASQDIYSAQNYYSYFTGFLVAPV